MAIQQGSATAVLGIIVPVPGCLANYCMLFLFICYVYEYQILYYNQLHYTNIVHINTLYNTKLSLLGRQLPRMDLAMARTSVRLNLLYILAKDMALVTGGGDGNAGRKARECVVSFLARVTICLHSKWGKTNTNSEHLGSFPLFSHLYLLYSCPHRHACLR